MGPLVFLGTDNQGREDNDGSEGMGVDNKIFAVEVKVIESTRSEVRSLIEDQSARYEALFANGKPVLAFDGGAVPSAGELDLAKGVSFSFRENKTKLVLRTANGRLGVNILSVDGREQNYISTADGAKNLIPFTGDGARVLVYGNFLFAWSGSRDIKDRSLVVIDLVNQNVLYNGRSTGRSELRTESSGTVREKTRVRASDILIWLKYPEGLRQVRQAYSQGEFDDVLEVLLAALADYRNFITKESDNTSGDIPEVSGFMAEVSKRIGPTRAEVREPVKVFFSDLPESEQTLGAVGGLQQIRIVGEAGVGKDIEKLRKVIETEKPEVVVIRSDTKAFKEKAFVQFAAQNGVRAIVRMGVEVDADLVAAKEAGISVIATKGNANSVANLTLYLLRTAFKRLYSGRGYGAAFITRDLDVWPSQFIKALASSAKKGRGVLAPKLAKEIFDDRPGLTSAVFSNLRYETVGLVGFGDIAQATASQLKDAAPVGVPFNVMAISPSLLRGEKDAIKEADDLTVRHPSEEEFLSTVTLLSFHMPGTRKGEKPFLTLERLRKMTHLKAIINTSRQSVVDTEALKEFLKDPKHLYLADVDLLGKDGQPLPEIAPFVGLSNAILVPHIGASTEDAAKGVEEKTVPVLQAVAEHLLGLSPSSSITSVNGVLPMQRSEIRAEDILERLKAEELEQIRAEFLKGNFDNDLKALRLALVDYRGSLQWKLEITSDDLQPISDLVIAVSERIGKARSETKNSLWQSDWKPIAVLGSNLFSVLTLVAFTTYGLTKAKIEALGFGAAFTEAVTIGSIAGVLAGLASYGILWGSFFAGESMRGIKVALGAIATSRKQSAAAKIKTQSPMFRSEVRL
ncbi:MAG: NAD(P)-dependent oxidoreductase, partial [Candidatus Omnitrophica bacterium]|nr:NAD(P)-dependent oxidoreductase [Candidatus Omnitrophota bacterium]